MKGAGGDRIRSNAGANLVWRAELVGSRVQSLIWNDSYSGRFTSEGTTADINDCAADLREAVQTLGATVAGTHDETAARSTLKRLASEAFLQLLGKPEASKLQALRNELNGIGEGAHIQLVSSDTFFPWEMLLPEWNSSPDLDEFMGRRFVIQRHLGEDQPPVGSTAANLSGRARMGLLAYRGLRHVHRTEAPYLLGRKDLDVTELPRLQVADREGGLVELGRFLDRHFDVIHFAGHARGNNRHPSIWVSKKFSISLNELKSELSRVDRRLTSRPLVFLNACETGTLSALHASSLAKTFIQSGAKGVIATECLVPDGLAAEMTKHLYERLLRGEPVGEALQACRRDLNSVYSLAYSLYASPHCCVLGCTAAAS